MSKEEEMLKELKQIRELLTPPPEPVPKNFIDEFKLFLKKYRVFALAVAFIMAIYTGYVIQAFVDDIIMPIIEIFLPGVSWEEIVVGVFRVGHLMGAIITFIIVAFVIFLLVKAAARMGLED
ncbi:MAG: MscL family protein [Candidatus Hermodarchaeota archaeon]